MVNQEYKKYYKEISNLAEKLENSLEQLPGEFESMEEREIRYSLESLVNKLQNAKFKMEHFSLSTEEGFLRENENGRFELNDTVFTCGHPIEVYLEKNLEADIEEGWYPGRVEGRFVDGINQYYFFGANKPSLYPGMKARIRKERWIWKMANENKEKKDYVIKAKVDKNTKDRFTKIVQKDGATTESQLLRSIIEKFLNDVEGKEKWEL